MLEAGAPLPESGPLERDIQPTEEGALALPVEQVLEKAPDTRLPEVEKTNTSQDLEPPKTFFHTGNPLAGSFEAEEKEKETIEESLGRGAEHLTEGAVRIMEFARKLVVAGFRWAQSLFTNAQEVAKELQWGAKKVNEAMQRSYEQLVQLYRAIAQHPLTRVSGKGLGVVGSFALLPFAFFTGGNGGFGSKKYSKTEMFAGGAVLSGLGYAGYLASQLFF